MQLRIGPINFKNKISILRNSRCDFLIGLDILRRFKCEISFNEKFIKLQVKRNVIRVPLVSSNVLTPEEFRDLGSEAINEHRNSRYIRDAVPSRYSLDDDLDEMDYSSDDESNNRSFDDRDSCNDEENEQFVEGILCNNVSMEGV